MRLELLDRHRRHRNNRSKLDAAAAVADTASSAADAAVELLLEQLVEVLVEVEVLEVVGLLSLVDFAVDPKSHRTRRQTHLDFDSMGNASTGGRKHRRSSMLEGRMALRASWWKVVGLMVLTDLTNARDPTLALAFALAVLPLALAFALDGTDLHRHGLSRGT